MSVRIDGHGQTATNGVTFISSNICIITNSNGEIFLFDSKKKILCQRYDLQLDEGAYVGETSYLNGNIVFSNNEELGPCYFKIQ